MRHAPSSSHLQLRNGGKGDINKPSVGIRGQTRLPIIWELAGFKEIAFALGLQGWSIDWTCRIFGQGVENLMGQDAEVRCSMQRAPGRLVAGAWGIGGNNTGKESGLWARLRNLNLNDWQGGAPLRARERPCLLGRVKPQSWGGWERQRQGNQGLCSPPELAAIANWEWEGKDTGISRTFCGMWHDVTKHSYPSLSKAVYFQIQWCLGRTFGNKEYSFVQIYSG